MISFYNIIGASLSEFGAKLEMQKKSNMDAKDDYNSSNDDYSEDGEEDAESYKPGGYHPVKVGEIYNNRYQVVEKMGWGHFSTVWLCLDLQVQKANVAAETKRPLYVAMKVQKSASHYRDAAIDEIELLQSTVVATTKEDVVKEYGAGYNSRIVILLDDFEHHGPNGRHVCMVFEMLGENLLRVIKNFDYKGMNIEIVRNFTREICLGLDFLHRHCQIIHTDLKPENILIAVPPKPKDSSLKLLTQSNVGNGGNSKVSNKTNLNEVNVGEKENHVGNKPVTAEQKKKLKRKNKKKRQKAKRSEKNARKDKEKNMFTLSPTAEQQEMALMEKASEPGFVVPKKSARNNTSDNDAEDRALNDKVEAEENSFNDLNLDDDQSVSSLDVTGSSYQVSLESLSPPHSQSKGRHTFSQVVLRSRDSQPWLRHSLLAAINFRSIDYPMEQIESPLASSAPFSQSESTLPAASSSCPLRLNAIDPSSFSFPSDAMWSVIHMVSNKAIIIFPLMIAVIHFVF